VAGILFLACLTISEFPHPGRRLTRHLVAETHLVVRSRMGGSEAESCCRDSKIGFVGNGQLWTAHRLRYNGRVDQILVVEMGSSSRFWDRIANRYSRQPIADEAAYQKKLEITRSYFRSDMEVLEFGCGTGSTAISHSPSVRHIRAIDISSKMIEIAEEKAANAKIENITFEQSTIEMINVPDQSFDVVLGLSILHLLEDKEDAISKVHRMLKPGGVFVTSTSCIGDSMKFFKVIAPVGKFLGLMPLVRVFTTEELAASLTDAGFEIDHQWQPGKGKAVFIVAKKAG